MKIRNYDRYKPADRVFNGERVKSIFLHYLRRVFNERSLLKESSKSKAHNQLKVIKVKHWKMINFLPKTVPKAPLILKNLKSQADEPRQTKEESLAQSFKSIFKVIFSFESKGRTQQSRAVEVQIPIQFPLSLSDLLLSNFAFKNLIIRLNLQSSLCCRLCLERFSTWKWAKLCCQTELGYSKRERERATLSGK